MCRPHRGAGRLAHSGRAPPSAPSATQAPSRPGASARRSRRSTPLHQAGRSPHVVVPETRPLLQGSRLTAWELTQAGVECTLIGDGMIASRLRLGDVACVIVGADRIAANGDVANKIGTYGLALAARAHGIPFYVAAPSSTLDPATPDGAAIPIEQRESRRGGVVAGRAHRAGRGEGVEPGIRHDASGAHHRHHHRPGHFHTAPDLDGFIARAVILSAAKGLSTNSGNMASILALDQGTTGSTALVIHQDGTVLGRGYREFTQHFPQPGWVEHDAEEIFRVSVEAMREAVDRGSESGRSGSASPISGRRWCSGTAERSRRWPAPSSGRTAAPPIAAGSSGRPAWSRCSASAPVS